MRAMLWLKNDATIDVCCEFADPSPGAGGNGQSVPQVCRASGPGTGKLGQNGEARAIMCAWRGTAGKGSTAVPSKLEGLLDGRKVGGCWYGSGGEVEGS